MTSNEPTSRTIEAARPFQAAVEAARDSPPHRVRCMDCKVTISDGIEPASDSLCFVCDARRGAEKTLQGYDELLGGVK